MIKAEIDMRVPSRSVDPVCNSVLMEDYHERDFIVGGDNLGSSTGATLKRKKTH